MCCDSLNLKKIFSSFCSDLYFDADDSVIEDCIKFVNYSEKFLNQIINLQINEKIFYNIDAVNLDYANLKNEFNKLNISSNKSNFIDFHDFNKNTEGNNFK